LLFFLRGGFGWTNVCSSLAKRFTKTASLSWRQKSSRSSKHGWIKKLILARIKRLGKFSQSLLIAAIGLNRILIFSGQVTRRGCFCFSHIFSLY
jgi:hypothetical protein